MKIKIFTFSRLKHEFITNGLDEYRKRLRKSIQVEIESLSSKARFDKLLSETNTVLLDRRGEERNSEDFANWLSKKISSGAGTLNIIIGPDKGFQEDSNFKKAEKISLSTLTFSGELSVLVLMEQIYRAFSIIQKTQYHK